MPRINRRNGTAFILAVLFDRRACRAIRTASAVAVGWRERCDANQDQSNGTDRDRKTISVVSESWHESDDRNQEANPKHQLMKRFVSQPAKSRSRQETHDDRNRSAVNRAANRGGQTQEIAPAQQPRNRRGLTHARLGDIQIDGNFGHGYSAMISAVGLYWTHLNALELLLQALGIIEFQSPKVELFFDNSCGKPNIN